MQRLLCAVLLLVVALAARSEDGFLVGLADSLDLNEFTLMGKVYTSQSLYSGVDDFQIIFLGMSF